MSENYVVIISFAVGKGPFATVLDVFGTGGGKIETRAALLASRGIFTLHLAYFNYEGLPKDLSKLELDYFEVCIAMF